MYTVVGKMIQNWGSIGIFR